MINYFNKIDLNDLFKTIMHVNMTQPPQFSKVFSQLKEGDVIEPAGSGKTFMKWAGLLVAPDMEACEWMKANVGIEFFNEYVVRILHASPERFYTKSNMKQL